TLRAVGVWTIRNTARTPDAEEVSLAGGRDLALFVLVGQVYQHLYLNAARVAGANSRNGVGPDEKAAVANLPWRGRHVHPVELRDEVLVLLLCPQVARRF